MKQEKNERLNLNERLQKNVNNNNSSVLFWISRLYEGLDKFQLDEKGAEE